MAMTQRQQQATFTEMEAEWLRRDLRRYVPAVWPLVESKPFKNNWHIDAICDHLAYVTLGDIRNLIIKALLISKLRPLTRLMGHTSGDWPY